MRNKQILMGVGVLLVGSFLLFGYSGYCFEKSDLQEEVVRKK
jgi:hypothetical protein